MTVLQVSAALGLGAIIGALTGVAYEVSRRICRCDVIPPPVRFSTRQMLTRVAIAAILCAYASFRMQQERRSLEIATAWYKSGVVVTFDYWYRPKAAWTIPGNSLTDAALARLVTLTDLRSVSLHTSLVTDRGMVHLKRLTSLRQLLVGDLQISDAGVAQMAAIPSLEEVELTGTNVTPNGMVVLTKLRNLKHVRVHANMIRSANAVLSRQGLILNMNDKQIEFKY